MYSKGWCVTMERVGQYPSITYFDFAENEHMYLENDYKEGRVADYMGAASQNVCERYLKHIIDECMQPQTQSESEAKLNVLKTHNLIRLVKYLEQQHICHFTREERNTIATIDGFYFTTRYPGDDASSVDKADLDNCMDAMNICRDRAIEMTMQKCSVSTKSVTSF